MIGSVYFFFEKRFVVCYGVVHSCWIAVLRCCACCGDLVMTSVHGSLIRKS